MMTDAELDRLRLLGAYATDSQIAHSDVPKLGQLAIDAVDALARLRSQNVDLLKAGATADEVKEGLLTQIRDLAAALKQMRPLLGCEDGEDITEAAKRVPELKADAEKWRALGRASDLGELAYNIFDGKPADFKRTFKNGRPEGWIWDRLADAVATSVAGGHVAELAEALDVHDVSWPEMLKMVEEEARAIDSANGTNGAETHAELLASRDAHKLVAQEAREEAERNGPVVRMFGELMSILATPEETIGCGSLHVVERVVKLKADAEHWRAATAENAGSDKTFAGLYYNGVGVAAGLRAVAQHVQARCANDLIRALDIEDSQLHEFKTWPNLIAMVKPGNAPQLLMGGALDMGRGLFTWQQIADIAEQKTKKLANSTLFFEGLAGLLSCDPDCTYDEFLENARRELVELKEYRIAKAESEVVPTPENLAAVRAVTCPPPQVLTDALAAERSGDCTGVGFVLENSGGYAVSLGLETDGSPRVTVNGETFVRLSEETKERITAAIVDAAEVRVGDVRERPDDGTRYTVVIASGIDSWLANEPGKLPVVWSHDTLSRWPLISRTGAPEPTELPPFVTKFLEQYAQPKKAVDVTQGNQDAAYAGSVRGIAEVMAWLVERELAR